MPPMEENTYGYSIFVVVINIIVQFSMDSQSPKLAPFDVYLSALIRSVFPCPLTWAGLSRTGGTTAEARSSRQAGSLREDSPSRAVAVRRQPGQAGLAFGCPYRRSGPGAHFVVKQVTSLDRCSDPAPGTGPGPESPDQRAEAKENQTRTRSTRRQTSP